MAEACEECTQNCQVMHKRSKNPDRVTTTFFKVMLGDDYSKYLFLPPRFARSKQDMVGKTTQLEDMNGEKWKVKFTKVDGVLAFEKGWNKFALDHKLKEGDFLVFHYIIKSHFVVLMYGHSGCPENRHFGIPHQQTKETENKNNLIMDSHSPSNVNTNGHNFSPESSSQSERSAHEVNKKEIIKKKDAKRTPNVNTNTNTPAHEVNKKEIIKKKGKDVEMTRNVNTNTNTGLLAQPGISDSDKETGQRSEPLIRKTSPDNMVSGTPTTLQPLCLVDTNNDHVQEECTKNDLQPEMVKSDGVRENSMVAKGGVFDETKNVFQETFDKRMDKATEKRKATPVMQGEPTHDNSRNKRSRNTDVPLTPARIVEKELDTSGSRLPNEAKRIEAIPKEPTTDHGSAGLIKMEPKAEPVDYDEAPPSGSSSTSFSAVMRSYKYLELPDGVKLKSREKLKSKSKVILLKNGRELWAVLYQTNYGITALTHRWGAFAKESGIKPGDNCEFVLESEPTSCYTCHVFNVRVTSS